MEWTQRFYDSQFAVVTQEVRIPQLEEEKRFAIVRPKDGATICTGILFNQAQEFDKLEVNIRKNLFCVVLWRAIHRRRKDEKSVIFSDTQA